MTSETSPILAVARPAASSARQRLRQIALGDVRQHQILLVTDADFAERIAVGEVGDRVHLRGAGIARSSAFRLERQRDDGVARRLVVGDRIGHPGVEAFVGAARGAERRRAVVERQVIGIAEAAGDLGYGSGVERERAVTDAAPFRFDLAGKGFGAELVHQNLDARLPDIVASAVLVVGAQHRLDVAQHVAFLQKRLDGLGEERRAAESAADHDFETGFARAVAIKPQRQIVDAQSGAIARRRADRDLELARHEGKFRMQRHVLANELGPDAGIFDLVRRDAGPLVGGDVAHVVAAGLHAVQACAGKLGHGVGQFVELDPVKLDVLARREMAEAAVVAARDMRQHAQLRRRQGAVGNGDAQHVGVEL